MQFQKEWSKPELNFHGSVEQITEQTFTKEAGSGDSITLVIAGNSTNIPIPGQQGTLGVVSV